MFKINPLTQTDFYKVDHRNQYPKGTTLVYSNLTARSDKLSPCHDSPLYDGKMVVFGIQYFIKSFIIDLFNENFFKQSKEKVVAEYKRRIETSLGKNAITYEHIEALHDLGYMPIKIKALPEGSRVPMRVPFLTIVNTLPEFYWVTNFLETALSANIWKLCTNATIAYEYKKLLMHYAKLTGSDLNNVKFQGHDFSFRGMSGNVDAAACGMAHLTSFVGTDSIPAIDMAEYYYNCNTDIELVGCSVPATEHSVMCLNSKETEIDTYRRLITKVYPKGIVSIVSDTWDFWNVVTNYMQELKHDILARDGKVVIRPDSGNPVDIICGNYAESTDSPERKGLIKCLYEIFGGAEYNGYKHLDSHIGAIYGDSITLKRANDILDGLAKKGFASDSIVFGIGSYTYQYSTRDSFGMAVKSTYGEVNGEPREIFKDPKTDNGIKKSAKGLFCVNLVNGEYVLKDQCTKEEEQNGELRVIFENGALINETSLSEIRNRLN